jgi:hypothetical protein
MEYIAISARVGPGFGGVWIFCRTERELLEEEALLVSALGLRLLGRELLIRLLTFGRYKLKGARGQEEESLVEDSRGSELYREPCG